MVLVCLGLNTLSAQRSVGNAAEEWQFGLGVNVLSDGGSGLNDSDRVVLFSNPIIVNVDYSFTNQFTLGGSLSFNKINEGKKLNGWAIVQKGSSASYTAIDMFLKFNFRELLNYYIVEPYVFVGFGYSDFGSFEIQTGSVPSVKNFTGDFGFGANYWFSQSWGVNLNIVGKYGIKTGRNKEYITNQRQYSLGVFYALGQKRNWRS